MQGIRGRYGDREMEWRYQGKAWLGAIFQPLWLASVRLLLLTAHPHGDTFSCLSKKFGIPLAFHPETAIF